MNEQQLREIAERAAVATPGPWEWRYDAMVGAPAIRGVGDDVIGPVIIETDSGVYPPNDADRVFIAAARTDVPALIAEVERLRDALHIIYDDPLDRPTNAAEIARCALGYP